jgi:hypothetical protein
MLDREQTDRAAPVLHDDGRVAQVEVFDQADDRRRVEVVGKSSIRSGLSERPKPK